MANRSIPGGSEPQEEILEANFSSDFSDLSQEWKRLLAEVLGTFGLVLVAAGMPTVSAALSRPPSSIADAIAPGLVLMALIYAFADVSGAHFNPAVTIAFALRRDFPWRRVPGFVAAQLIGALLASWALLSLFGGEIAFGATTPAPDVAPIAAICTEAVLTAMLVLIILGTTSGAKIVGHNAAIAVGAFVVVAGLLGGPVSGGSMNPARSLGPDIVRLNLSTSWIYVVGPLLGVLLAVLIAQVLRGRRSKAEEMAASGLNATEPDEGADD